MRPDGLVAADTPVMDALMAAGRYTLDARTVMPSATLPCHTSLFYGVGPDRPFILSGPGIPAGVIEEPVAITDIAPTIVSLFGRTPPDDWIGRVVQTQA